MYNLISARRSRPDLLLQRRHETAKRSREHLKDKRQLAINPEANDDTQTKVDDLFNDIMTDLDDPALDLDEDELLDFLDNLDDNKGKEDPKSKPAASPKPQDADPAAGQKIDKSKDDKSKDDKSKGDKSKDDKSKDDKSKDDKSKDDKSKEDPKSKPAGPKPQDTNPAFEQKTEDNWMLDWWFDTMEPNDWMNNEEPTGGATGQELDDLWADVDAMVDDFDGSTDDVEELGNAVDDILFDDDDKEVKEKIVPDKRTAKNKRHLRPM